MKPQIKEAYIDTGKVRFEFRHFPYLGVGSVRAAHASTCAHTQGKFWEYHDYLYGPSHGAISESRLMTAAEEIGIDKEAFTACLGDTAYAEIVTQEFGSGRALGIRATPTFLVNGRPIVGAHPFQVWSQLIEFLLADIDA